MIEEETNLGAVIPSNNKPEGLPGKPKQGGTKDPFADVPPFIDLEEFERALQAERVIPPVKFENRTLLQRGHDTIKGIVFKFSGNKKNPAA